MSTQPNNHSTDTAARVFGCVLPTIIAFFLCGVVYLRCSDKSDEQLQDTPQKRIERLEYIDPAEKQDPAYLEEKNIIDSLISSFMISYRPQKIFVNNSTLYVVMETMSDDGYDQVAEGYALEIQEKGIKSIHGVVIINSKTAEPAGIAPIIQ